MNKKTCVSRSRVAPNAATIRCPAARATTKGRMDVTRVREHVANKNNVTLKKTGLQKNGRIS